MNYTLHQLNIFLRISNNQSITRTAEELFLTQPAVSIQLKNFQNQFSIPLTEVVGRKLYVTEFGMEIAEAAQKIIHEVDAINYKTLAFKGELSGKLKISVASTGKYVMPYFLSEFIKEHKGVELIMDVTNKSKVVRSMERNEVDFALVSVLPRKLNIHHVELMKNQLFLVGNNERKFEGKTIKKEDFENLSFIYREDGSATRDAMETFITKHHHPVRKKIELTSNEAVKQAVVAGLGYSIMPLIGIKNEIQNKDLQIITTKGLPMSTQWCLIWLKAKKLSPTAEAYLKFLNDKKELIIQESFGWIKEYQKS
ncbi:LysR family transcriptional regulator [Nonlabens antarcticus]|uniref:LysR family transcriptional regulator n=1 Tax=Nonlabens antarcticus TaxID=392714 RepID=UPI001891A5D7|nr:LysR family transcriptional regulator [Nonlabens antarcticus]